MGKERNIIMVNQNIKDNFQKEKETGKEKNIIIMVN